MQRGRPGPLPPPSARLRGELRGALSALGVLGPRPDPRGLEIIRRTTVLCDVTTKFLDAPRIFGPQKGATPAMVRTLETWLGTWAGMLPKDIRALPGSGAAGGLAGGLAAFGAQAFQRDFSAVREERFVPPSRSRGLGLFATGRRDIGALGVELGARADRHESTPLDGDARAFRPYSLSAGLAWRFSDHWHATLNLDRAQRAPAEEELFSNGPHVASATVDGKVRILEAAFEQAMTAVRGERPTHLVNPEVWDRRVEATAAGVDR